jgi:transposase
MEEYITSIDQCGERISRIELQLQLLVVDWRMYPLVEALMALKGFAWLSATVIASELGDLRAYETPRHLMSYLGLVTSERTTGERVRKGSITKSGNSHARFFIVESSQHYCKVPKVSKELTDRQAGVSERIREISWNAQNRLYKRSKALDRRGVMGQKIQVALARELVGFVWAVGQEVKYGDSKGLAQGKGGKKTPS